MDTTILIAIIFVTFCIMAIFKLTNNLKKTSEKNEKLVIKAQKERQMQTELLETLLEKQEELTAKIEKLKSERK
ncbi:hypothetical protein NSQ54_05115 [Alkalihalobacillus sp. FSL W8-0930]